MSEKVGVVNKCPNCGATVDTSMVKCPTCGYIFGGVGANVSAWKLSRLLENADANRRSEIVVNFPVPTTKADLLEFMADLQHRAKHYSSLGDLAMASACNAKYRECAEKAHVYFENDPDFRFLFKKEAKFKRLHWENMPLHVRKMIQLVFWFSVLILSMVVLPFCIDKIEKSESHGDDALPELQEFKEQYKDLGQQVKAQVDKGNLKEAEYLLMQVNMPLVNEDSDGAEGIASFLDKAFIIVAKYYVDKGDFKSAEKIGNLLEGKLRSSILYWDTMTYKLISRCEENESTSQNIQAVGTNETKMIADGNKVDASRYIKYNNNYTNTQTKTEKGLNDADVCNNDVN